MNAFASPLIIRNEPFHLRKAKCCDRVWIAARAADGDKTAKRSTGMQRKSEEYARELAWAERKYGRRLRRPPEKHPETVQSVETETNERDTGIADERDSKALAKAAKEYDLLRWQLVSDTQFIGALITAAAWAFGSVTSAESAAFGSLFGLFYVFLLSRGIAGSAPLAGQVEDKTQGARIGLIVGLIFIVAKSHGNLQIIPAIFGFLSYKLAFILPLISGEAFAE